MLESIFIGLTGLNSYSRGLQMISNNVANLNTPGFKSSSLRFGDLFYRGTTPSGLLGSTGAMQFGTGVGLSGSTLNFRQGDLRSSGGDLDLAIQGRGFLVLMDGNRKVYVRTGQLALDKDGYIADSALGFRLGVLSAGGGLQTVSINGQRTNPPKSTSEIKFADNLSATATEHVISGVEVYDSNGGKHTWTIRFTNTFSTTAGRWAVTVEDEKGVKIKEGEIVFNGSTIVADKSKITIDFAPAGATASKVVLDFGTGVTGFSAGTFSSLNVKSKDGYGVGDLTRVLIDTDGQIKLEYSNGQSTKIGYVALADFEDLQGLTQRGDGVFEVTSGELPQLLRQGEGGMGTIKSQSVEASNVDLSQEFGQLILYQRGYQASSQVISVANEMIQQLFELRGRA
jgi:flagellar hook protein FlgE